MVNRNTVPFVQVSVSVLEAVQGTTRTIQRNGKRLQVKIPSLVQLTPRVVLGGALMITDGCPGNLEIRVNVAATSPLVPALGTDLDHIFQTCLSNVGGGNNQDIQNYVGSRDSRISRALFFEKATRTIWMAGLARTAVRGFLQTAQANGFTFDYAAFGSFTNQQLAGLVQKLHGTPVPPLAEAKWRAVHHIAQWLSQFPNEIAFQQAIFGGKVMGRDLDAGDVRNLTALHLPYMRCANISHTLRGMGGEFIKKDRWIDEFLQWGRLTQLQLETRLGTLGIPLGLFDLATWAYCEKFIKKTADFEEHFTQKFGRLK